MRAIATDERLPKRKRGTPAGAPSISKSSNPDFTKDGRAAQADWLCRRFGLRRSIAIIVADLALGGTA
jgi:hypothetical protein